MNEIYVHCCGGTNRLNTRTRHLNLTSLNCFYWIAFIYFITVRTYVKMLKISRLWPFIAQQTADNMKLKLQRGPRVLFLLRGVELELSSFIV